MKGRALRKKRAWLRRRDVMIRLRAKFGKDYMLRIREGVNMVAIFWKREDGTAEDFARFCEENFVTDENEIRLLLDRFERNMAQIYGINLELYKILHRPIHLDAGSISKWDRFFARMDPFAAMGEALFTSKIAFVALLNFPSYATEDIWANEDKFNRIAWIVCRLTGMLRSRMPERIERRISDAEILAEEYIGDYNFWLDCLIDLDGKQVFTEHKKVISHWGLRDEIKAQHLQSGCLERQRVLVEVMKKVILQEVPEIVINNPDIVWDPARNNVYIAATGGDASSSFEENARYRYFQQVFLAEKAADRYYSRTALDRAFKDMCEIPEQLVEGFLKDILTSPCAKQVARIIKRKLGRPLQSFDIWFNKFSDCDEKALDLITQKKYPSVAAFEMDIPRILKKIGFAAEKAKFIASSIKVEACRGSGHAWGTLRREDKVLLRTPARNDGMLFQELTVAMHELGHTVEQVMSVQMIDNLLLSGMPNSGFSEAFAFLFENRRMEVLGQKSGRMDKHALVLKLFWETFEIAGVALLDIYIWRWMYKHLDAKPEEINLAFRSLAKSIWNKYFAPVMGVRDEYILAIYSHIINYALYLPNYPIGHIVAFQVLDHCTRKNWPEEMERMCKIGCVSPNKWAKEAVGESLSLSSMIKMTKVALKKIK